MQRLTTRVFQLLLAAALSTPVATFAADGGGGPFSDSFKLGDRAKNFAEDNARYRDARQKLDDANADVMQGRQAAVADYQSSPDYVNAAKAVGESYRAFTSKKREVTRNIEEKDPRYAELSKQAADIDTELANARANPATTIVQFQELYNKKSVFTREMHALENDALEKANSTDLRKKWEEASRHLTELRAKQDAAVEQSAGVKLALAEVTKARDELDDLGAKLAGSKAAYTQAQTQQNAAENYLQRYPTYNNAYDGWGYGWGLTPYYGGTIFYTGTVGAISPRQGGTAPYKNPTWPWYH